VSQRVGRTSRKASAGDFRLLAMGVVLVAAAIVMAFCEPLQQSFGSSPAAADRSQCQRGWVNP
jgi:hypothetical protein